METVEYKSFINGKWVASVTGRIFENRNPADTREFVGTFQRSDKGDANKAVTAMRDVYTDIFYINAPAIGAEVHLPFEGTKATGNGHREAGQAASDVFSEWKAVYIDFSGTLQKAQMDG